MITLIKQFNELTAYEIYKIIQLREEVFIAEQKCLDIECDGNDIDASHIMVWRNEKQDELLGTARLMPKNHTYYGQFYSDFARIGRVVSSSEARAEKLGMDHHLMKAAMNYMKEEMQNPPIILSAQAHLQSFYNHYGFQKQGDVYDEGGIPHIKMIYTPN